MALQDHMVVLVSVVEAILLLSIKAVSFEFPPAMYTFFAILATFLFLTATLTCDELYGILLYVSSSTSGNGMDKNAWACHSFSSIR